MNPQHNRSCEGRTGKDHHDEENPGCTCLALGISSIIFVCPTAGRVERADDSTEVVSLQYHQNIKTIGQMCGVALLVAQSCW